MENAISYAQPSKHMRHPVLAEELACATAWTDQRFP